MKILIKRKYIYMNNLSEGVGGKGVPHSISELEVRGCTKVCSEIGLFLGESGFLEVGFLDFVASLQKTNE